MPFARTKIAFRAKSAEDLMRGGLQILAFNETFAELNGSKFIEKVMAEKDNSAVYRLVGDMMLQGRIIWENNERGINPNGVLAQKMGVILKPPRLIADKRNNHFRK